MSTHYGYVDWPGICYRHTWELQPLHCFRRSLMKVVDPFLVDLRRGLSSEKNLASCAVKQGSLSSIIYTHWIYAALLPLSAIRWHLLAHSTEDDSDWFLLATREFFFVQGCAKRKKGLNQQTYLLLFIGYSVHWGWKSQRSRCGIPTAMGLNNFPTEMKFSGNEDYNARQSLAYVLIQSRREARYRLNFLFVNLFVSL